MPHSRSLADYEARSMHRAQRLGAESLAQRPAYAQVAAGAQIAPPSSRVHHGQGTDDLYPQIDDGGVLEATPYSRDDRTERYHAVRGRRPTSPLFIPAPAPGSTAMFQMLAIGEPAYFPPTPASDRMTGDAGRAYAFYNTHRNLYGHADVARSGLPPSVREKVYDGRRVVDIDQTHLIYICRSYADLPVAELTAAEWAEPPLCALTLGHLLVTPALRREVDSRGEEVDLIEQPIAVRPTPTSLQIFAFKDFLKWWIVRGTNPLTRSSCHENALMRVDVKLAPKSHL